MTTRLGRDQNPVVITGLACRFPGEARNATSFWDLLCTGQSAFSSSERFHSGAFRSKPTEKPEIRVPSGAHFLSDDVAAFDANFFGINANEAKAMDPQQRIMLEIAYEAFENAALSLEKIAGSETSCYIGNFTTDYKEMLSRDPEHTPQHAVSGTGAEIISNRISWFFDLRGPSMTLGTACSSSLVALHQGCQSLHMGESNMALVGGSNLLLNPDMFQAMSKQQFLANDGLSKSFDAKGDGYGRGEGFAAIILKRFDDAIRDCDPIRAVIRGSGVNQDGRTKGMTVPNTEAQVDLIRSTYRSAGLDFKDTHYCEAHGTGTKVGDPVELEAVSKTFGSGRGRGNKIIVGSVKPNIGHLEATAGLAGVIKSVYILENGLIPPNIYFEKPNPRIPFDEWNIEVPVTAKPWPVGGPRRVSVQSFGYGGTNAHAILDDAFHYLKARHLDTYHCTKSVLSINVSISSMKAGEKPKDKTSPIKKKYKPPPRIFVLSAQDQYGLKRQRVSLLRWLQDPSSRFANQMKSSVSEYSYVRDLAFTLGENRSQLAWKSCSIASSRNDLCSALDDTKAHAATQRPNDNPRLGFVFTGQGAQWAQMGIELNVYPVFQESMRLSDEYLRSALNCPWSAVEEIQSEWKDSKINRRAYCQPICTILQLALVDLLASWNVVPSIVVGHSSGEIAAAYCLGCLSKEDALKIAYYRGLLSSEIGEGLLDVSGAMMAIGASEAQAQGWIDRLSCGEVVVACINSPSSTTVSGDLSGIEEMQAMLTLEGVFARRLEVDIAYHSPHMDRVSGPYLEALKMVQPTDAGNGRQLFSSVTGCVADPTELGPMYWVRNLLSPVLFYDALYTMLRPIQDGQRSTNNSVDLLIEIGPNSALKGPVQQILKQHELPGVEYRSTILRDNNAVQTILAIVGELFNRGVRVNIRQVNNFLSDGFDKPPQLLLDLPSYSWDHSRRFWSESRIHEEHRNRTYPHLNLLGAPYPSFGEGESIWRGFWRVSEEPWIQDHVVQGSILYPAAGYIVMAVEAAHQVATKDRVVRDFRLREVEVVAPMVLTEDSEVEIIFQLRPRDNFSSWSEFTVSSSTRGEQLQRNCHGFVNTKYMLTEDSDVVPEKAFEDESYREAYAQIEKTCQHAVDPIRFYEELESLGISYGPSLRNLAQITLAGGKSHCRVDIPNYTSRESSNPGQRPHVIHPATLDGLFHFVIAAFKAQDGGLRKALVPKSIEEITISASVPFESNSGLRGICDASKHGDRMIMSQLVVFDEKISSPAVSMKGFCWVALSPLESSQQEEQRPLARRLFSKLVWQPAPKLHEKSARHYHYTILETPNATPLSHSITTELENLLNRESFETSHTSWNHKILDWKDNHCISIIELETPFLADMTADDFVTLKRCILETSSLLWVVAVDDPRSDLILGLARVVRNEIPGKAIRTLRFQSLSSSPTRRLAEIIKDIATTSTIDNEFLEEGGTLKVCRLVEDLPMIEDMSRWTGETTDDSCPPRLKRTSKPQRLATASMGMLDTLHLEEDTILQNSLASDEVEIEVKATGLKYLYLASILSSELTLPSFRDVMVVMGQMPDELLGFDASGIIVRAGKDVTHFEIGDAVCTLGHGTHRSLLRNKANLCQPLPQSFSFEEAATLPLVHCTAFYALVHIARVQKGQSVLIHAAAGGVGQAAIQIAQHFGAEIFVTVGSVEKRRLIQKVYGVARDHIFSSRDLDFAKGVLRMTNGRGVDCVLNSLSGEALQETWRCIAPFGKFIEIGMRDIMGNTRLEMRPFLQDATFTFFNLEHVMKERPELMATIMNDAFDLLRRGTTKLVSPVVSYPISEVEGAFRLMQTGKHKGKIALDWSLVSTNPEPEDSISPFKLDQNASYLLVGGLGGLGRSLANFLVGLGARYLCFISRSGDQSTQAKTLLQDLQKRGVQIGVYRCNIANRDLLAKGLQLCSEEMPPIKGVFQCAMALHDTVFERLTYQQWVQGLEPKVQGSWNLHVLLPQNLDFHVTLSSFVGLFGGRSQSSYSAGSVFQDALAFHRRSLGLKAVTVDLGIMRDVGRLAEHGSTDFIQEWEEPFGIREYEFHGLMKKIIVAEVGNTGETPPQIITGLPTGASAQAAGIRRPYYFDDPRFTILAETRISQKDHDFSPNVSNKKAMLFEQVAKEKTLADAAKVITEALVARVAKSLQTTISEIDERQSLHTYGIDSLVAVEILDWIFKQMKVVVSVFDILATRPISDFAMHLAFKSQLIREAQTSS